ncbi:hypothetical protein BDW67DRAFT_155961 [Aspergillus spinulosporus]
MERSLTRCLRSRPTTATTSLLSARQSILYNQLLLTRQQKFQSLRFSSSTPTNNDSETNTDNNNTTSSTPPPPRTQLLRPKYPGNIDEVLNRLNLSTGRQNRAPPRSEASNQQTAESGTGISSGKSTSAVPRQERRRVDLKLNPTLGRDVAVVPERGQDLEVALKRLSGILKENNVKYQYLDQKYHVRRGQMRKNLRIRRWRKLFAYSFAHTVGKIQRMRAQGW